MACISTLTGITTSCGSNLSSIKQLWIGQYESASFTFTYETGAYGEQIIEDVTAAALVADSSSAYHPWVEFKFRKNTGEMNTEMTVNDNGGYYFTNNVNLVFSKQDQAKRLALQAVASGECAMVVLDSNGIYWLIGANDPVTATTLSATTGVSISDSNQYSVTLGATEGYMPIPLDDTNKATIISALTTMPE